MKLKFLIALLLVGFISNGQSWQQIAGWQRFTGKLGIPVRDTISTGAANDSAQIVIRPQDGKLYIKYKTNWVLSSVGNDFKSISDSLSASGYTRRDRTKQQIDSLGAVKYGGALSAVGIVPKLTGNFTFGNSSISDNGTNVIIGLNTFVSGLLGVNTLTPQARFHTVTTSGQTYSALFNTNSTDLQETRVTIGGFQNTAGGASASVGIGAITNHAVNSNSQMTFLTANASVLNEAGRITSDQRWLFGTGTNNGVDRVQVAGSQSIAAGTLPSGGTALSITGTLNSTVANQLGNTIYMTGSGSGANTNRALDVNLLAGYTGTQTSFGINARNASAGVGQGITTGTGFGNSGVYGEAQGTTIGHNAGGIFTANRSSTLNVGVVGRALNNTNSPLLNIGAAGIATLGTANVGGFFGLLSAAPPAVASSAALIAENGPTTSDIFRAHDNGVEVFVIKDGGRALFGTNVDNGVDRVQIANSAIVGQNLSANRFVNNSLIGAFTAPTGDGQMQIYSTNSVGLFLNGQGSIRDIGLYNKNGSLVASIPTGTTNFDVVGSGNFGGAVTSTQYKLSALNTAPSSATDTGTTGEIRIDANFIYICTATNTWKRVAISTW